MLCDRIMDLSQFTLFAIVAFFLAGVPEATSWGSNELNRPDGYDLQRGPVFYEAYYPDDQGPSAAMDQQRIPIDTPARRYFDRANVLEKTYQAIEATQDTIPHGRDSRPNQERLIPMDFNTPSVPTERFRSNAQPSRNPQGSDQAYEVARQLKRFVEGLEQDSNPQDDLNTRNFEVPRRLRTDYERAFPDEKILLERKLDDYMNIILSAVKKEALEISKARLRDLAVADGSEDVGASRQQRFVESQDSFNQPQAERRIDQGNLNTFGRSVKSGSELQLQETESQDRGSFSDKRRYVGDEYQDVKGPVSQMRFPRMENIFQPRPQVISYVFSPSRTKPLSSADEPAEEKSGRIRSDNLVGSEMKKKVEVSDGLGVASIEVSEMPRHKIRHHHGEKPRRRNHRNLTEKEKQ